jgi:hypothetical protein
MNAVVLEAKTCLLAVHSSLQIISDFCREVESIEMSKIEIEPDSYQDRQWLYEIDAAFQHTKIAAQYWRKVERFIHEVPRLIVDFYGRFSFICEHIITFIEGNEKFNIA